jgi:hypothetical protein
MKRIATDKTNNRNQEGDMMKSRSTRYSLVALLIGFISLAAVQTKAQNNSQHIELLSYSFGVTPGQTARISLNLPRLANPSLPTDPVSARLQILGTEGEVLAQLGEIKVAPAQTRFWDVPCELLPASKERTGRHQVQVRLTVVTPTADFDPQLLLPAVEIINSLTGETVHMAGKTFLIFVSGPNGTSQN